MFDKNFYYELYRDRTIENLPYATYEYVNNRAGWHCLTLLGPLNSIERNEPPQRNFPAVGLSWSVNPLIMITLHSLPLQFIDAVIVFGRANRVDTGCSFRNFAEKEIIFETRR